MSADFLQGMAASSRARIDRVLEGTSREALRERALSSPAPVPLKRSPRGFDIIAELKLKSPALGTLGEAGSEDIEARVRRYAAAGAIAVSVLTEPDRFDGELGHLERASRALQGTGVPTMRKDFLVDAAQVHEARIAGAGGVLVILRMLDRASIEALLAAASECGLFVLLEAFDAADVATAAGLVSGARNRTALLVGVNSRDLTTLAVSPGRLEALAPALPRSVLRVAESGLEGAEDAARMRRAGYDVALVGGALMKSLDPASLLADMLEAGRSCS